MPSVKVILMLSAIVMAVYFVDNSAASPYPSIGNNPKGKTKRLGNCAFFSYNFPVFCYMLKRKYSMTVHNVEVEKKTEKAAKEKV